MPNCIWRLEIEQDARYPNHLAKAEQAVRSVSGRFVARRTRIGCLRVYSNWKHWVHVFPQHGPGRTHERKIELEPWQRNLVSAGAKEFLAGLIHSDGCRHINAIKYTHRSGRPGGYKYVRYSFSNVSDDIRRIFCEPCDVLGVHWTTANARNIAVSRREDVAFLDTFIGPKS
jgi:hypothetical protein